MVALVSVHVAKAGGTSLQHALRSAFRDGLMLDYADNPANPLSTRNLDPDGYFSRKQRLQDGIAAVHGHFHPGKFDLRNRDCVLFTMLREPVENVISIYYFWRQMPRQGDALHEYVLDNSLSLIDVARLPLIRRLYSFTYFGGFDMGRFDLIGRHAERAKDLALLADLIGIQLEASVRTNVTPPNEERMAVESDPTIRHRLRELLRDDIEFYERHSRVSSQAKGMAGIVRTPAKIIEP